MERIRYGRERFRYSLQERTPTVPSVAYIDTMLQRANSKCTSSLMERCGTFIIGIKRVDDNNRLQAISPYSPHDNSTAIYLRKTDEIISGTVSDFVGNDPLIYRRRLTKVKSGEEGIRTQRDDVRVLDSELIDLIEREGWIVEYLYGLPCRS